MSTFLIHPTQEQEKVVKAFLKALDIAFEQDDSSSELPAHVLEGIAKSREDIEAGRFITFEDFKKRLKFAK
ncbi:DUF2683 family protein [Mucilaginibacter litoreus]|uniref:DUF2683 family protein n=1 Tax=Mucilaginibacter litoreus TaxID=1048221 RepID=A0ABW3AR75_9SPHI